jgi:hypothetical protein
VLLPRGAGEVEIFDRRTDGVGVDETYQTPGYLEEKDTLTLEVAVFLGRVEVLVILVGVSVLLGSLRSATRHNR